MCSKRCTKVGGRGEPGNPQLSTSSDTGDSFPFYFVGIECALKEGGERGGGEREEGKSANKLALSSGTSFYLFLQLSTLGASCLPSFPV